MKRRTTGKPKKQRRIGCLSGLTETEQHLQNGYQLETESLGAHPLLRRLKNSGVVRPLYRRRAIR